MVCDCGIVSVALNSDVFNGRVIMQAISPGSSLVTMTELVLPHHMNAIGTVFGGVILSWIDIAGSIAAAKHCSHNVVTASIDDVHFYHPVYKGNIVHLQAQVNYVHRTSIEVGVQVRAENFYGQNIRHTVTAYMTLVALDENSKPTKVPPLLLETEEEKRRFAEAAVRRERRLERKKSFKENSV